jgi:GR25 family glycosyltransferase involved in LPS biosynthesis
MQMIPVVVIKTPNSTRINPLLTQLEKNATVKLIVIEATMGFALDFPSEISVSKEMESYGRTLTQNERACAISHTRAREILATSDFGGAVLEDDARIINVDAFISQVCDFLETHRGTNHVLTLLDYSNRPQTRIRNPKRNSTFRLLAEAPLAVGVALTPIAAKALVIAASKRSMTADWPTSPCVFFGLRSGVVTHGDADTESVIGDLESRVTSNIYSSLINGDLKGIGRRLLRKIDTFLIHVQQSWELL